MLNGIIDGLLTGELHEGEGVDRRAPDAHVCDFTKSLHALADLVGCKVVVQTTGP